MQLGTDSLGEYRQCLQCGNSVEVKSKQPLSEKLALTEKAA